MQLQLAVSSDYGGIYSEIVDTYDICLDLLEKPDLYLMY